MHVSFYVTTFQGLNIISFVAAFFVDNLHNDGQDLNIVFKETKKSPFLF